MASDQNMKLVQVTLKGLNANGAQPSEAPKWGWDLWSK
jgi:hypothetical protein